MLKDVLLPKQKTKKNVFLVYLSLFKRSQKYSDPSWGKIRIPPLNVVTSIELKNMSHYLTQLSVFLFSNV